MAINSWPLAERPREKLLARGPQALSDAELLAIFLRTGIAGKTAIDLAREVLMEFGGLRGLLKTAQRDFCATPGLGPAKYAQLQAVHELARRYLGAELVRGELLRSATDTRRYLQIWLRDCAHEVFCGLFLDSRHRVLACEELARGTLAGATVYPREILKRTLALNAAAVIFAHNHPSGIATPSLADKQLTARLKEALATIDVRVLDHLIIGDGETVSFCELGLL